MHWPKSKNKTPRKPHGKIHMAILLNCKEQISVPFMALALLVYVCDTQVQDGQRIFADAAPPPIQPGGCPSLPACWERALSIFQRGHLQTASVELLNKINNIYSAHALFIFVIFNQKVKLEFFCHRTLKGFLEQVEIKELKMPCLTHSESSLLLLTILSFAAPGASSRFLLSNRKAHH